MREILDELLKRKDIREGMLEEAQKYHDDDKLLKYECPDFYLDSACPCDFDEDYSCKECWKKALRMGE